MNIQIVEGLGRIAPSRKGYLLALHAYTGLELPSGWRLYLAPKRLGFLARALVVALKQRPSDVVVAHVSLLPIAFVAAKLIGARITLLTYGWDIMLQRRWAERWCGYRVDRVLAISRVTALGVDRLFPRKALRRFGTVGILPPTWRQDHAAGATHADGRKPLGVAPDDIVLLTVGRMDSSERCKGHDRVLEALPELLASYSNLRYLVVGEGDDLGRLMERARELKVEARVTFAGYVEDLALCYAACDLFVMPSTQEGFGIVFLEALASGRPVVAGGIDGSLEAVGWGELAFLCDPFSPESVAGALRRAIDALGASDRRVDGAFLRAEVELQFGTASFDRRLCKFFGNS